jgi:hypothetical protein
MEQVMTGRHRSSSFRQAERALYKTDRTALDFRAAARGPVPLAKRLVRRRVTRAFFGLFRY